MRRNYKTGMYGIFFRENKKDRAEKKVEERIEVCVLVGNTNIA